MEHPITNPPPDNDSATAGAAITNNGQPITPPGNQAVAFKEGEEAFAWYEGRLYEVKVLENNDPQYKIHYQGWNKCYDTFVSVANLMKKTDKNKMLKTNLDREAKLNKEASQKKRKPRGKSNSAPERPSVVRGTKRKNVPPKENTPCKKKKDENIRIPIAPMLKRQLIDDHEFINKLNKLFKLPRKPNVDGILKDYLEATSKKERKVTDSDVETLEGLRCYFDKALPVMLLYEKERNQYKTAMSSMTTNEGSPSTVYGAEHLLRLLVKLPELLAYNKIEASTLEKLLKNLSNFAKFLEKNQKNLFLGNSKRGR